MKQIYTTNKQVGNAKKEQITIFLDFAGVPGKHENAGRNNNAEYLNQAMKQKEILAGNHKQYGYDSNARYNSKTIVFYNDFICFAQNTCLYKKYFAFGTMAQHSLDIILKHDLICNKNAASHQHYLQKQKIQRHFCPLDLKKNLLFNGKAIPCLLD